MSFTLTFGQEGNCATAQVVWSVNGETYNFRSDNNFVAWISTIFTVADVVAGGGGVTNPLVLPDNTNALGYSLSTIDNGGVGGAINLSGDAGGNGGTINLSANSGGSGGSINTSATVDNSGGNITTTGGGSGGGGSINTSGGDQGPGGNIDTSNLGGYINTAGGGLGAGGAINTSNGGGSIDTRGFFDGGNGGSINTSGGTDSGGNGGSINTSGYPNDSTLIGGSINTSGGADGPGGSINTSNGGGLINTRGVGSIEFGVSGTRTTVVGSANTDRTITMPNATGTMLVALTLSPSINFGACAGNGAVTASAQTVTGAEVGDAVIVTCTTNRTTLTAGGTSNIVFDGVVTATNAVSVRAHNPHGNSITLGALDFKVIVLKGL